MDTHNAGSPVGEDATLAETNGLGGREERQLGGGGRQTGCFSQGQKHSLERLIITSV